MYKESISIPVSLKSLEEASAQNWGGFIPNSLGNTCSHQLLWLLGTIEPNSEHSSVLRGEETAGQELHGTCDGFLHF